MSENTTASPGQLRQFEEQQGYLPQQTNTPDANTPQMGPQTVQPPTWQDMAAKASFNKGDYFEHDNKVYHQSGGKTYLVTGDAMGDVELDGGQTAQLEKDRAGKAAQEKFVKDAMAQQPIATEGYASAPPKMLGSSLVAQNGDLCHYDANGKLLGIYPYTSGVQGVTDPSSPNKGPIPSGSYTLNTEDISGVSGFGYYLRNRLGDWGHYRVPLTPAPETETYGRGGFYIHGGTVTGSKGCVDVGPGDVALFPELNKEKGAYSLTVK